ncbi:MAG: hypothetical protein MI784_03100 [Cytophagales bacterium]|nr:hypothetical protein [Cytophagales bacterium]
MVIRLTFFTALLLTFYSCVNKPLYRAEDFKWKGIFGYDQQQSNVLYSLLGDNAFTAHKTNELYGEVLAWLNQHPKAIVVPVYSQTGHPKLNYDDHFVACWIVDPDTGESLNLLLIKKGLFSSRDMEKPNNESAAIRMHISPKTYENFMLKARYAEVEAFKLDQGIWK